jgi:hypothetical protein
VRCADVDGSDRDGPSVVVEAAVTRGTADDGAAERDGTLDNVADRDGLTPADEPHDDRNVATAAGAASAVSNTRSEIDRRDRRTNYSLSSGSALR